LQIGFEIERQKAKFLGAMADQKAFLDGKVVKSNREKKKGD